MFTGLIEKIGRIERMERIDTGARLTIAHDVWPSPLVPGESVAVQGACLTVTRPAAQSFTCDVLEETLQRTTLAHAGSGMAVNLERAMRAGDRFGGHMVSGHVDGAGVVRRMENSGRDIVLEIACAPELLGGMVMKGSIAIDGISLTITAINDEAFAVNLIPFTREHTTLNSRKPGDAVNLELDMLGKYVRRYMEQTQSAAKSVTMDDLQRAGFC
jgi:riboflavin synthase